MLLYVNVIIWCIISMLFIPSIYDSNSMEIHSLHMLHGFGFSVVPTPSRRRPDASSLPRKCYWSSTMIYYTPQADTVHRVQIPGFRSTCNCRHNSSNFISLLRNFRDSSSLLFKTGNSRIKVPEISILNRVDGTALHKEYEAHNLFKCS